MAEAALVEETAPARSKSGFAHEHLRSFVDRIERLNEERDALTADIREVYSEAKGQGFDTKVLRRVVREELAPPATAARWNASTA